MKIYTKTGDSGETGLYGGARVRKDDPRVEAYGAVDEANAALGAAAVQINDPELRERIVALQSALFTVGSDLATPLSRDQKAGKAIVPRIDDDQITALEALIDLYEAELPSLTNFILPGGTVAASALHIARGIVRRAERRTVTLLHAEPDDTNAAALRYLNRLADLLFVLARIANARANVDDVPWRRPES